MEHQIDKAEFLNENLLPDTNITIGKNGFLIAEFSVIAQDTTKYFNGYYY